MVVCSILLHGAEQRPNFASAIQWEELSALGGNSHLHVPFRYLSFQTINVSKYFYRTTCDRSMFLHFAVDKLDIPVLQGQSSVTRQPVLDTRTATENAPMKTHERNNSCICVVCFAIATNSSH